MNPSCPAPAASSAPPKTAIVICAVLEIEIAHYAAGLPHLRRVEILRQGLHNEPDRLREEVQQAVDRVERECPEVEAIVLGYGLCSRGTEGVTTSRARLVMPRAHDCITLLLGSKEHYAQYVREHPGTYWYSPGWNLHHIPPGKERYKKLLSQYVEKYGEDNAQFLMEEEQHWFKTYDRATYVELTVGATEQDVQYTKDCAKWLGWNFDHQHGDPALLKAMLSGPWDEERFLVLEPGQIFRMTADHRVLDLAPAGAQSPAPKSRTLSSEVALLSKTP